MKTGTMSRSRGIATGLTYFFLIAGALLMIFPFLWMILTSLKSLSESVQIPPTIFPAKIVWSNFKDALTSLPFVNLYINTIIMVLVRVICAIVFSSMAGYAFAKLHFKGKNLLFTLVLVQMMMPSQIFVIPQYQMLAKVGLTESIFALIFPGLVSAFGTFFLRQAYMGIPNEIGEAAYLDGCNQWQTFTKVMLPPDRHLGGRPDHLHRRVCLCRPHVASGGEHRHQPDDPVLRPGHPEGPVYDQLPRAHGGQLVRYDPHADFVPHFPAPVYRGHCPYRQQIRICCSWGGLFGPPQVAGRPFAHSMI